MLPAHDPSEPSAPLVTRSEYIAIAVVAGGAVGGGAAAGVAAGYVAPVIAGIVAIVVAIITAREARVRLRLQLAAEGDRHAAQLAHNAQQTAAQLAHDRQLAELQDLRVLLDEAAIALRDVTSNDQALSDDRRASVASILARLRIRLGSADDTTIAFARAHSELAKLETANGDRRAYRAFEVAIKDFYDAAAARTTVPAAAD